MKYRSVVVQEHPDRRRRLRLLVLAAVVLALIIGLLLGSLGSARQLLTLSAQNTELAVQLQGAVSELDTLQQAHANSEVRGGVDAAALELVRVEMAQQQASISELEKGLHFYKSLMAGEDEYRGISVRSIELVSAGSSRRFGFRILVQQSARKHDLVQGSLDIKLVGLQGGAEQALELSNITEEIPNPEIRLRFKYFQAIDGFIDLPEGFAPQYFEAVVRVSKPKKAKINRTFPWSVQEKLTHVGQ